MSAEHAEAIVAAILATAVKSQNVHTVGEQTIVERYRRVLHELRQHGGFTREPS